MTYWNPGNHLRCCDEHAMSLIRRHSVCSMIDKPSYALKLCPTRENDFLAFFLHYMPKIEKILFIGSFCVQYLKDYHLKYLRWEKKLTSDFFPPTSNQAKKHFETAFSSFFIWEHVDHKYSIWPNSDPIVINCCVELTVKWKMHACSSRCPLSQR